MTGELLELQLFRNARQRQPQPAPAQAPGGELAALAEMRARNADDMTSGEFIAEMLKNVPHSSGALVRDLTAIVRDPKGVLGGMWNIGKGVASKVMSPYGSPSEKYADAAFQHLKDRYGGKDALLRTLRTDPVGIASDFLGFLTLGSGLAVKGAATAGKLARVGSAGARAAEIGGAAAGRVMQAANLLDPANVPFRAAGRAFQVGRTAVDSMRNRAAAVASRTDPKLMHEAFQAGVRSPESAQAVVESVRGERPYGALARDIRAGARMAEDIRAEDMRRVSRGLQATPDEMPARAPAEPYPDFGIDSPQLVEPMKMAAKDAWRTAPQAIRAFIRGRLERAGMDVDAETAAKFNTMVDDAVSGTDPYQRKKVRKGEVRGPEVEDWDGIVQNLGIVGERLATRLEKAVSPAFAADFRRAMAAEGEIGRRLSAAFDEQRGVAVEEFRDRSRRPSAKEDYQPDLEGFDRDVAAREAFHADAARARNIEQPTSLRQEVVQELKNRWWSVKERAKAREATSYERLRRRLPFLPERTRGLRGGRGRGAETVRTRLQGVGDMDMARVVKAGHTAIDPRELQTKLDRALLDQAYGMDLMESLARRGFRGEITDVRTKIHDLMRTWMTNPKVPQTVGAYHALIRRLKNEARFPDRHSDGPVAAGAATILEEALMEMAPKAYADYIRRMRDLDDDISSVLVDLTGQRGGDAAKMRKLLRMGKDTQEGRYMMDALESLPGKHLREQLVGAQLREQAKSPTQLFPRFRLSPEFVAPRRVAAGRRRRLFWDPLWNTAARPFSPHGQHRLGGMSLPHVYSSLGEILAMEPAREEAR